MRGFFLVFVLFLFILILEGNTIASESLSWKVEYDDQDRIIRGVDPAGRITQYRYTYTPSTDGPSPPTDRPLQSITVTPPEGEPVTWRLDHDGQLASMKDGQAEVAYRYDNHGRLESIERKGCPSIRYKYDAADRIAELRVGDFYRIAWAYDFLGRVSSLDTPAGLIRYDYQTGQNMVIRTLPNGVKTFWKRQPNGELEEIIHGHFKKPDDTRYSVLAEYKYTHGPEGRIKAISERSGQGEFTRHYVYDKMNRLTDATGPSGRVYHYEYDPVGNRTKATATGQPDQVCAYDWAGRLTSVDGKPCKHDACGNLTEVSLGGMTRQYRYHSDGRLAEAQVGGKNVQYRYDGFGRLVARSSAWGEEKFLVDPLSSAWQPLVIEESDGSRTLIVWDGVTPLAIVRKGRPEFLLHDHLGSVRLVVDEKGNVARHLDYDPFGTPPPAQAEAGLNPRFAGLFWEADAGIYHTLARGYKPEPGAFLQPDPILASGWNQLSREGLYVYGRGNPICYVDREGETSEWHDNPDYRTSPNFFSALFSDIQRSVADQVDDARLRARAQAGKIAYEKAMADGVLQQLTVKQAYDAEQMTLFVRKFDLTSPLSTFVPHAGIHFGREITVNNLRFDGIELQNTRIAGRNARTVIVPMWLAEQEPRGVIQLQLLETDAVQVEYQGRVIPIRDIPAMKKAEIQSHLLRRSLAEMGLTRGNYKAFDPGASNSCVDMALDLLDKSIADTGIKFSGEGFHAKFTTRLCGWAAANPTVYLGGLASQVPRTRPAIQNFMADEIGGKNRGLSAKLLREAGNAHLSGRPGDLWKIGGDIYKNIDFVYSGMKTMRHVSDYPGDPANDLRLGTLLLKTYGLVGEGSLLASAAGAAATHIPFAEVIGSGIRSRVLQNRMERQLSFGGAVLPGTMKVREDIGRYHGSFSVAGAGFSGRGAWSLTGTNDGLFGRNRHFVGYASSEVEGLLTPRGERISGTFRRGEIREERGGSLFNFNEPTSVTVTKYRHETYNISHKGGLIVESDMAGPHNKLAYSDLTRRKSDSGSPDFLSKSGGQSPPPPSPPPPGGSSSLIPSPVGGIYLGGAGSSLNGLGMLKGIHTDANGNLILIGEGGVDIKLPPLRLDDVVTVFRSVYLYGEGPTVTIDPNPENPEKSAMIIRHGKATDFTYVGWILYQADRLMKSYCQGVDNKTEKDVESRVSGYPDILDTIYFGGADPRKAQKEGVWERFWIVPAEAHRFDGPRRELTLFDVPLKVKTQKMKWEKDKLVDDTKGKSSPGATAFTSWFTTNYDGIAAEQYLTPPPESGITEAVAVFSELRRIAIVTAVAEKLRDQGVAMPFWMRDYEVRKVPFERFTPGMEVTRKRQQGNTIQSARIFGGVQLSPDTKSVKTYNTEAEAAKAPAEMRAQMVQNIKLAAHLERAVGNTISPVAQEPLTVHQVREENRTYQAVAIPGAETLALGPCRLDEVDLTVPVEGGREIRLVRSFNSFFDPKGPWGRGWALDLPRLEEIRVPIIRDGNETAYSTGFELLSPFNSLYARFRHVQPVAELGGAKMQVPDTEGPFHGLSEMKPDFLQDVTTRVLLLKDGREWHFTKHGDLVAIKDGPQVTVYERGPHGRLTRMVAVLGGQVAGRITLEYTPDSRLTKMVGDFFDSGKSKSVSIAYTYDDTGRLAAVISEDGTVGYKYDGVKVSAVTWQDKASSEKAEVLHSYKYDSTGRVLSEKNGDATIVHAISAGAEGVAASSQAQVEPKDGSGEGTGTTTTHYDRRMRPTKAIAADGASTHWTYPEAGGVEMTVTTPEKKSVKIVESPDGRKRTIQQDGAPPITASFDTGGRLTHLAEGDQTLLAQEWRPDGQLWRATNASQGSTYKYDQYGLLSDITLHPAKAGEKLSEWQNMKLDRKGQPVEITDYSGMKVHLAYDDSGSLTSAVQKTPDGNLGYNVKRDDQGRIEAVKSSWGETAYSYDKDGSLKRVISACRGQSASVELASGLVHSTTGFDGGLTTFAYQESGPAEEMPKTITCPNGLKLNYTYSAGGDLSAIKVGAGRLVRLGYDKQGRVTSYAWEPVNP